MKTSDLEESARSYGVASNHSFSRADSNRRQVAETILLETDCYSIAVAHGTPTVLAVLLPLLAAFFQVTVLWNLAFAPMTRFNNGHWLTPVADFQSVNAVKALSIVICLFKVSNEFKCAQQLYAVLAPQLCKVAPKETLAGRDVPDKCRMRCGVWALALQYTMAMGVLVVSLNLVLSAESCSEAILKALAVFIVVDMDNVTARFVCLWLTVDFEVTIHSGKYEKLGQFKAPTRAILARKWHDDADSSEDESEATSATPGTNQHVLPCQASCHLIPLMVFVLELGVAIWTGVLPLTYVTFGIVSNENQPVIGIAPFQVYQVAGVAKYRALLLAPINDEVPPVLWWVAVKNEPEISPIDSLEIVLGKDAKYNTAYRSGSQVSSPVQAKYWLQANNFTGSEYHDLLHQRLLYTATHPYEVSFTLMDLETKGAVYRVYITAQNPKTMALAPQPMNSHMLIINTRCKVNCTECNRWDPTRCQKCADGTRLVAKTHSCVPCPGNCRSCSEGGDRERCDPRGCNEGFGRVAWGKSCIECSVANCFTCDAEAKETNSSTCDDCMSGFGRIRNENGTFCTPCEANCAECDPQDPTKCKSCRLGFVSRGGACAACPANCQRCSSILGPTACHECSPGYGFNEYNICMKCDDHIAGCTNCSWNDHQINCHNCKEGLGLSPGAAGTASLGAASSSWLPPWGSGGGDYTEDEGVRCVACGNNCLECASGGSCQRCVQGFALGLPVFLGEGHPTDNGQGDRCLPCADNCHECPFAGPQLCDVCDSGYLLTNATQMCTHSDAD